VRYLAWPYMVQILVHGIVPFLGLSDLLQHAAVSFAHASSHVSGLSSVAVSYASFTLMADADNRLTRLFLHCCLARLLDLLGGCALTKPCVFHLLPTCVVGTLCFLFLCSPPFPGLWLP